MKNRFEDWKEINKPDQLYPPSLEALKAEPWRWLIADPRDPRVKKLIGKKVFPSDDMDEDFVLKPIDLKSYDYDNYDNLYFEADGYSEGFRYIWPAPIDMQGE